MSAVSDVRRGELEEERDFLLRSLRDLEAEHEAGDIGDVDYETLKQDYTARAAATLRALTAPDEPPAPVAGPGPAAASETGPEEPSEVSPEAPSGVASGSEPPPSATESSATELSATKPPPAASWLARHRKVVLSAAAAVIVLAGAGWAVVASSSHRDAGQEITGLGVGAGQETKMLLAAQQAANKGDNVTELKDLQAILASDPTQPQALTMEGWLYVQTGRKALVAKGIGLLTLAEEVDPGFAEPHVYRGIAYLSEGKNKAAVPELRWYLAHKPDPTLAPKVRAALAKAEAALAKAKK